MSKPVAHIRVEAPKELRGTLAASNGVRVFIVLPGHEEIELSGIRSVTPSFAVNDVMSTVLDLVATVEIVYV